MGFDLLSCSWPRPVAEEGGTWVSEPEWDAPLTHLRPEPSPYDVRDGSCWAMRWRELFRGDASFGGEMRRFHVVFRLRVNRAGTLRFWDDDGSVIRRNGEIVHDDRSSHALAPHAIDVRVGDQLEVAHWQLDGDWMWGGRIDEPRPAQNPVLPWLDVVRRRLLRPNGPPLKIYCQAREPIRTLVAVYSMILNGYAPSGVFVYGDHQWDDRARATLMEALPFASIVPLGVTLGQIDRAGGSALVEMAERRWFVMKSCVSLLCAPHEFCLVDDDVVVLDDVHDALDAFRRTEFVFAPDLLHESLYVSLWGSVFGRTALPTTGSLNTGLYWLRNGDDPAVTARLLLRGRASLEGSWAWEQGFFAHLYANRAVQQLPSARYLYPLIDGLPGGVRGYDYALNPCRFATIHFGGPVEKPNDEVMLQVAPQILGRRQPAEGTT